MRQAYLQSIEGCLHDNIGEPGLETGIVEEALAGLASAMADLRKNYADGSLPLLRVPEDSGDLDILQLALDKLLAGAKTLVVLGTGGSSLGGQTLCALAVDTGCDVRFIDNLDPVLFEHELEKLDIASTRFAVISKSGNTPETLTQAIIALAMVKRECSADKLPEMFLGITEPAQPGVKNGHRGLFEYYGIPLLEHNPGVGGRYSAFTNVGMLPAIASGLDARAVRAGAASVVAQMLREDSLANFAPAVGAAMNYGLAVEKNINVSIMMPYSGRLQPFSAWYSQLWAESLGKQGKGTAPVTALGPVDQHSQLQLFLDGPQMFLFNLIKTDCKGRGIRINADIAALAGADYLGGNTVGDLVNAQQNAIEQTFRNHKRPIRVFSVDKLDEYAIGSLMMHFILETILMARLLRIDPFDQPAVEMGKILTREYLEGNR
jgi:glucose-6-phosphate isomerase